MGKGEGAKSSGSDCGVRLISAVAPLAATPDRVAADDGVAAAGRTAFDRLEETVRPLMRELEHDRDRRFEVGDEPRPSDLRRALIVAAREA